MVFERTEFIQSREIKSRRDGILLTVDFNLRTKNAPRSLQQSRRDDTAPSPLGEGWGGACIVPAGLLGKRVMLASP